jgi:N-acyl-D-aspartate/D-glutamate deacylase
MEGKVAVAEYAAQRGARVVGMALFHPNRIRLTFSTGLVLDAIPGWNPIMHLPHEEKCRALADPSTREKLRADARRAPHMRHTYFAEHQILDVQSSALAGLVGRFVGEIARERDADPLDTLLDIALADDLQMGFLTPANNGGADAWWARMIGYLRTPGIVLAGSDAGAHLDMVQSYDAATYLVGPAVRDKGLLGLEEAVQRATDLPARLYGLRGRGRICEGWHADLAVFDAARFGPTPVTPRRDLPGGAWRLTSEAEGLEHVFVNGVLTLNGPTFTGDLPGAVLRSGRDTESVRVSATSST